MERNSCHPHCSPPHCRVKVLTSPNFPQKGRTLQGPLSCGMDAKSDYECDCEILSLWGVWKLWGSGNNNTSIFISSLQSESTNFSQLSPDGKDPAGSTFMRDGC